MDPLRLYRNKYPVPAIFAHGLATGECILKKFACARVVGESNALVHGAHATIASA